MPPRPEDFDASLSWFRSRVPMTDEEFHAISHELQDQAFTVANVSQLEFVNDVWQALDRAIENGTTLEDFKADVSDRLSSAWGKQQPYRVETIFRTWIQRSYSAGRFAQLNDPVMKKYRPFWQFVAILDSRTSMICQACDGTTRPADDPWWNSHQPPLHHNCRSTVISLTEDQAADDITPTPPSAAPSGGFGGPPDQPWEPDYAKFPPELLNVLREKKAA